MPWCPECRSEYRPGYTECKSCGGVALVEALLDDEDLKPEELESTVPVGTFIPTEIGQPAFILARSAVLLQILLDAGIPAVRAPFEDGPSPDMQPRFQVRVRPKDVTRAEEVLKAALEAPAEANAAPSDACEACGAKVPPDATECPDCGLSFVGGG